MKKDKYRFTLRFCDVSPKQITATDILISAGRRKSSLIADLIDEHIKKYGADAFSSYFSKSIALPANTEAIPSTAPMKVVVNKGSNDSLKSTSFDDEACNSILEGLSMFKT